MKTILLATDFSAAAKKASMYAIGLAKAFHSKLILFHAFQQPAIPVTESFPAVSVKDISEAVKSSLDIEVHRIDPSLQVVIQTEYKEALAANGIIRSAKDHKAELIVLGIKSSAGAFNHLFGSTVTTLIRQTNIPLMIVPEEAEFKPVNSIVLAYDSDLAPDDDVHVLDAIKQMAHRFLATVYLVHIAKTEFQEVYQMFNKPFRLIRVMHNLEPVVETLRGKSIAAALDSFIDQHHIDVLALMPEKKSLLRRIFEKSTTSSVVSKMHIPILVLPGFHEGKNWWWTKEIRKKHLS